MRNAIKLFPMAFTYQNPQYFLTQGNGPWGQQSWTYDRIGNRLSELAPPESATYSYLANPAGGHNPRLSRIEPAPGGEPGSRLDFSYDTAGNQTTATVTFIEGSGRTRFLNYGAESPPNSPKKPKKFPKKFQVIREK